MPKNIVLCCDGTRNEFSSHNTNVVKLYSILRHEPGAQVTYYHPGLGSMGSPSALTPVAKTWTKLFGLAFGFGLSQHLADLYQFLMQYYEDGDNVFVFGFSRGSYSARALCSILHVFGLIRFNEVILIPYAIRLLKKYGETKDVAAKFQKTFSSQYIRPHFVGVWDTVSSVGALHNPLKLPFSAFNPDIAVGRHAVAIDERRAFYRTNLWQPADGQDIKQVWFSGVHCDIGGGYAEEESGLSKIAFEWMVCEAIHHGLLVNKDQFEAVLGRGGDSNGIAKPDPAAKLHNSLPPWLWAEVIPRRRYDFDTKTTKWKVPLAHRRTIRAGSLIHDSVFARMKACSDYKPKNVSADSSLYRIESTAAISG